MSSSLAPYAPPAVDWPRAAAGVAAPGLPAVERIRVPVGDAGERAVVLPPGTYVLAGVGFGWPGGPPGLYAPEVRVTVFPTPVQALHDGPDVYHVAGRPEMTRVVIPELIGPAAGVRELLQRCAVVGAGLGTLDVLAAGVSGPGLNFSAPLRLRLDHALVTVYSSSTDAAGVTALTDVHLMVAAAVPLFLD